MYSNVYQVDPLLLIILHHSGKTTEDITGHLIVLPFRGAGIEYLISGRSLTQSLGQDVAVSLGSQVQLPQVVLQSLEQLLISSDAHLLLSAVHCFSFNLSALGTISPTQVVEAA